MLKNAIVDAKIYEFFAKIWRNFDKILLKCCQNFANLERAARWTCARDSPALHGLKDAVKFLSKFCQHFVKIAPNFSKIFINFCIQYSIFQHFSKSTHFCKILQKILQNFAKILRISENFAKFCKICQKMSKILQIFPIFWQKFAEFAREKVIFL